MRVISESDYKSILQVLGLVTRIECRNDREKNAVRMSLLTFRRLIKRGNANKLTKYKGL